MADKFQRSVVFYWLEDPEWPEWDRFPINTFNQVIHALLWVKENPKIRVIWLTGPDADDRITVCMRQWTNIYEFGMDNGKLGDLEYFKWLTAWAITDKDYGLKMAAAHDELYQDRVGC